MKQAQRISNLPPYLFARIEKLIDQARREGRDIISLGIGDPDIPTAGHIIAALEKGAHNPANHRYSSSAGTHEYREAVAGHYRSRFGVTLDPETEVVSLIGSKDGIAHISLCFTDPGDVNLVPDPAYPIYAAGTILAGGIPEPVALLPENGFLPRFGDIPEEIARRARLMFLNYPNNPTGAVAPDSLYEEAIAFARKHDIILCHDAAYADIAFDGYRPRSFLEFPGAREVGIEFGSPSKPFSMTGWRSGWAVGNAEVIEALTRVKTNLDSGIFGAVQEATIAALQGPEAPAEANRQVYRRRRDRVIETLNSLGWNLAAPHATIYIWAPVPAGYTSAGFAEEVLKKSDVVITPGDGYGKYGEGYFRISLTISDERLEEAMNRLKANNVRFHA